MISVSTQVSAERLRAGPAELTLQVERLRDLDAEIDTLFDELMREYAGDQARVHAALEERCPYFGCIWPSARALAEEALAQPHRRVLELGCGLALPSLALARDGRRALATDFHAEVPRFLARNLAHNGIGEQDLAYLAIDWRAGCSPEAWGRLRAFAPDSVVASDVLYEKEQPARVAECLARLFTELPSLQSATIADPGRPYLQQFSDEMQARGLPVDVAARTVADGVSQREIFILRFVRIFS